MSCLIHCLLFAQRFPFQKNQCSHGQRQYTLPLHVQAHTASTRLHLHVTTLDVPLYEILVKRVLHGFPAGSTLHTPNFLHTTRMGWPHSTGDLQLVQSTKFKVQRARFKESICRVQGAEWCGGCSGCRVCRVHLGRTDLLAPY